MEELYVFIILGIALSIFVGLAGVIYGFFTDEVGKAARFAIFITGAICLWYAAIIAMSLNANIAMFK